MKRIIATLCAITFMAGVGGAQPMPQDTWRYDGVQFSSPEPDKYLRCISIGSGGIYVGEGTSSSTTPTRVLQFTEGGAFTRRFTVTFGYILGIACNSAGEVFVLDRGDSKVKVFAADGTSLRSWGGPGSGNGQFALSSSDGETMIAVDKQNQVYVCDPGNTRVQVFDANGNFLRKWGQPGSLPGQFAANDPRSIVVTPDGRVVIRCDSTSPRLRIFDDQGQFLDSSSWSGDSICVTPDGLLVISQSNYNYFIDSTLTQVQNYYNAADLYGAAANARGDIYRVMAGTKRVSILEREYSNVDNPLLPPAIPLPAVTHVAQRQGVPLLDFDYKVTDADSPNVTTAALAFLNGNNTLSDVVRMSTFVEGTAANIGGNQTTGLEKRVTWDMAADWSVDFAQIQIEVLAKDSRGPLGIHWITVPVEGGQPAFEVSRAPVSDAELLSVWYWYIASGQPGMSFSDGVVRGAGGTYGTQTFASGTTTTLAGRVFAYEKMGFRGIRSDEMARALAGNYGFSSVDGNSVVREAFAPTTLLRGFGSDGTAQRRITPGLSVSSIAAIAAGNSHSLFVSDSGVLSALGDNGNGELGDGTNTQRTTPVQTATGVAQVAAGGNHSLFIKTDGSLWGTGYNQYGQLGDGTTTTRNVPAQVATGVTKVAGGNIHTLFIKTDGTLWATGYNGNGQLGDNSTTQRNSPVQITTGVAQVAAGDNHSLFVKTNGTLWAMGYNGNGQLGDGTTNQRNAPVQIATGVTQIAAGNNHSLFVKTDGSIWAMGYNGHGQLGDATNSQRSTPVQIATSVAQAFAGGDHSLFLKTDGTLWATGYNGSGQLADGTTTSRNSPIQVRTNVLKVATGESHTLVVFGAP